MSSTLNKHIVSIGGSKGGSAKTLTSHMLCQGLGLRKFSSILATSDARRNVRNDEKRIYDTFSAKTDEEINALLDHFFNVEIKVTSLVVIDGGASRSQFDVELAKNSSLVLIPFLTAYEDIELAIDDVENLRVNLSKEDFNLVRLLPSKYPTNPYSRESTEKLFKQMFTDEHRLMMLPPVIEMNAAAKLNRPDLKEIPTDVNNLSRRLADQILINLNEDPFQYHKRKF